MKKATETNQQPEEENILNIDTSGIWVKFFVDSAYKILFKAAKFKDENERLLFIGRFFESFMFVLTNLEENDNSTGAKLAQKLNQARINDIKINAIRKQIGGLETKRKRLECDLDKCPPNAQDKAEKIKIAIRDTINEMATLRTRIDELNTI